MNKKELIRSVKFLLFSISAGVIEIVSFTLLNELSGWSYWPCYLIALVLSVLWNFTLNRRYTFRSANNIPVAMAKVFAYYCVFTPVSTIGGNFLAETLGWNDYLVTIINMVVNFVTEFLFDRFIVFGKSIDTRDKAREEKEARVGADTGSDAGEGDEACASDEIRVGSDTEARIGSDTGSDAGLSADSDTSAGAAEERI